VHLFLAGLLPLACGSSTQSSPSDAGAGGDAPGDALPPPDTGSSETGSSCGPVTPHGTQLAASPTLQIDGVTTDGYAIYSDTAAMTVSAVPLAGGAPLRIGPIDATNSVFVSGKVVFFEPAMTQGNGITTSTLAAWTASGGAASISTSAVQIPPGSASGYAAVSQDGSRILFMETPDGITATLTLATVDGKTKTPLVTNLDVISTGCAPYVLFAGSNAVASFCIISTTSADAGSSSDGGDDGGGGGAPPMLTLSTFTGPTYAQNVLTTAPQLAFGVDSAGARVLVYQPSGLVVYPIAGGAGTLIDATGVGAFFTKDGANVIYTSTAPALKRSPVANPAPVTLAPGLAGLLALSPDESWVLAYKSIGNNGATYDVSLASALTPGTPTALAATPTAEIFGDAFTTDSKYAMYFANIDLTTMLGDFYVAPTAGGTPTKVTSSAWSEAAAAGSKVVVNDNCTGCSFTMTTGLTVGTADLHALDVAHPTAIATIASQAYGFFYLNTAKDTVVYSWTCRKDGTGGVYALPVP
jgi:hypothetical protein